MYTSKITPFPHHLHLAIATPHGDELQYVQSAIDTNWITCAGENVTAVEQAIPAYLAEHASVPAPVSAVALGTGTSALHTNIARRVFWRSVGATNVLPKEKS